MGWQTDVLRGGGRRLSVHQLVERCARCRTTYGMILVGNGLASGELLVDVVPWTEPAEALRFDRTRR